LNGRNLTELGYVECDGKPDEETTGLSDLQWQPGGKRLSFVYKHGLYTVPAE
jgi:hypothetical protein